MQDHEARHRHVVRTVFLVEARIDQYADYLVAVARDGGAPLRAAIERWREEERGHGEALERALARVDPGFATGAALARYRGAVGYHDAQAGAARGSLAAELFSRCVVEALAATLYRALADACPDAALAALLASLARDEARHAGVFLRLLRREEARSGPLSTRHRLRLAARRMLELDDQQIALASAVADGRPPRAAPGDVRREADAFARAAGGFVTRRHLRFAARFLSRACFPGQARPGRERAFGELLALGAALRRMRAAGAQRSSAAISAAQATKSITTTQILSWWAQPTA